MPTSSGQGLILVKKVIAMNCRGEEKKKKIKKGKKKP